MNLVPIQCCRFVGNGIEARYMSCVDGYGNIHTLCLGDIVPSFDWSKLIDREVVDGVLWEVFKLKKPVVIIKKGG
jgi:hypothetical protein